ncbi:enoyl-CoA hydratase/isomerase family protein [Salinivirga cyanobacteriivorans]|uniref:Putative enoyl-CoA hydratase echA8 n=1 Tax=Salinivirga cyanobacteriivorans TaxID=1307839 RepID=A0A0S2I1F8_9BACT|nr:enoyl-CoA hydratase/isomerase family protein [Salinivirga cyanobacteriivorans]ALO16134.1 putative enoyl-CoA hydratase echA8 [Salinivirga cyanobacteriivorans]
MENPIISYKENYKGVIQLNRAESKNTFNKEFAIELNNSLIKFDEDKDVRVVIIEAEGKHFSAGIALDQFDEADAFQQKELLELMDRHNHTIANMKKPVISAVKGYGIANGSGLAFASDLVVAAADAVFGTTAIRVGLACLGPAMPLSRHVGRKRLMQMLMTGQNISAVEAYDLGLVNWVVEPGELRKKTFEIADELIAKNPHALAAIKEVVYRASELPYHQGIDLSTDIFTRLALHPNAKHGLESFQKKTKPQWPEKNV